MVEAFSLDDEIASLIESLSRRGLPVALRHYHQAVGNYREERFESANGQLRSFLEDLLLELAAKAGKEFKEPIAAVIWMRDRKLLTGDESNLVRGLLGLSNERGAHRGLTEQEEARFRIVVSTSLGRYLLYRVRAMTIPAGEQ
jgi:hypothetical protein